MPVGQTTALGHGMYTSISERERRKGSILLSFVFVLNSGFILGYQFNKAVPSSLLDGVRGQMRN